MRTTLLLTTSILLVACEEISEEAFTAGKSEEACIQVIPACPDRTAACKLDSSRYARVQFPNDFAFLVDANPDDIVEVQMFFSTQRDAGLQTLIEWNEPGCTEIQRFDSQGRNIFQEAGDRRTFSERRAVFEGGEHLIEIISDMQSDALITVDVRFPER